MVDKFIDLLHHSFHFGSFVMSDAPSGCVAQATTDTSVRPRRKTRRGVRKPETKSERSAGFLASDPPRKQFSPCTFFYSLLSFFSDYGALDTIPVVTYPTEFLRCRPDSNAVRNRIKKDFPGPLVSLPVHGHLSAMVAPEALQSLDWRAPGHIFMRLDHVFDRRVENRLLHAWQELQATNPVHYLSNNGHRSEAEAFHFGVWERYRTTPTLTRETTKQPEQVLDKMDKLLKVIQQFICPRVVSILQRHWQSSAELMNL